MDDKRKIVRGQDFYDKVCEVLDLDVSTVQRIVIDASWGDLLKIYVQRVGDRRLLQFDMHDFIKGADVRFSDG